MLAFFGAAGTAVEIAAEKQATSQAAIEAIQKTCPVQVYEGMMGVGLIGMAAGMGAVYVRNRVEPAPKPS